jgi:signal recognition particle subunit SRP54
MGGMLGLPGRRKATKSPKNKRKGTKGAGGTRRPAGLPGGMPALPPGLDPSALESDAFGGNPGGLPGFKPPKLDFGRLTRRKDDNN